MFDYCPVFGRPHGILDFDGQYFNEPTRSQLVVRPVYVRRLPSTASSVTIISDGWMHGPGVVRGGMVWSGRRL